jgi:hypothetical protein
MTSCTKQIWTITFENRDDRGLNERVQKIAANSFIEVLTYFNKEGLQKIVKVQREDDNITFTY